MKRRSIFVLLTSVLVGLTGCSGQDDGPTNADPLPMTLLATLEPGPGHVISFYDSDLGIVISEQGSALDTAQHPSLETLRGAGMAATYRALANDANVVIPANLLSAEARWLERQNLQANATAQPLSPPPGPSASASASRTTSPGTTELPSTTTTEGETIEGVRAALGGLSTDASWWQNLPICQYKTYGTPPSGTGTHVTGWFDGVWCVTDVTWATTGWRDTMYYETTAFGQGNFATVKINKWINGAWQTVINTTVAYRQYQTFSFPPENGAYYQTFVSGNAGHNIGISERYRLAMPQPTFVNNKPSDVEYDFSNDLQGITHDANSWFLTRTKYDCVSIICTSFEPKYGLIAKVPLGTSLNNGPTGHGMPSSWNTMPGGGIRYNHFGDLVHVAGRLYVAMDGFAGAAVGIYDTNLTPITYAPLSQNWGASFVAYNPKDGYFYVPSDASTFQKYRISVVGTTATATWRGTLKLNRTIPGAFQGAKFSPKGNLWLLTGANSNNREFWGIDGANGAVFVKGGLSAGDADESEGLDIFDLDTEKRPGMAGQLHLQMLDNNVDDDNWWLMHWRAPMDRL